MPNRPALLGAGATGAYADRALEPAQRRRAEAVDASDADEAVLALQQRTRETLLPQEGQTVVLDTDCSLAELHGRVQAALRTVHPGSSIGT